MPIPDPIPNEEQSIFIGRCNGILSKEYPDSKQRNAICYSQWRKSKKDSDGIFDSAERNISFNIDSQSTIKIDESTGFLVGKARVTRSGVFDYHDQSGNLMREYRSPEEVFDEISMNSLALKPILNNHPSEMVNVNNIKDLQIGTVGDSIEKDGIFLKTNIVITDKDMIETIINRKKIGLPTELSCGYSCMLVPEIGIHDTEGYYTFIQKNIRYNHVSIVDKARAGNEVKILDSKNNKKEFNMADKIQFTRKAINLDSLKVDAIIETLDEESLKVVNILNDGLDNAVVVIETIKKDNESLKGQLDQANENIKKMQEKIDSLNNINSPVVAELVASKIHVDSIAKLLDVDCTGKDIKTIKVDCIKKVSEDFNPEGKSDLYINGRFDSIQTMIENKKDKDGKNAFSKFMQNVDGAKQTPPASNPRETFIKKDSEQNRK